MTETKDFATQAGHFYKPDGSPAYEVPNASKPGEMRATTVKDARKHGYLPSVTTILRQAAAPGLERWKIANAVMSALTLTRQEGEADDAYIDRILKDSNEQAVKARDRGTAIHGAIERAYNGLSTGEWAEYAAAAHIAVEEAFGRPGWVPERSFGNRELGFGGKLDLSAEGLVLDFKTSDKPLDTLKLWPEHRRQLAAYRMGLGMPGARCAIVYVGSIDPGAKVIELGEDELKQGWEEFKALLAFWVAMNKHDPRAA